MKKVNVSSLLFIFCFMVFCGLTYAQGKVPYYELKKRCQGNSCCLASLERMEKSQGFLVKGFKCPVGHKFEMLRCEQSYQWCELLEKSDQAVQPEVKGESDRISCPMDAKICPDGTAVSREGPNCIFAPCLKSGAKLKKEEMLSECEIAGGYIKMDEECNGEKSEWCVISKKEQCYADQVVNGRCSVGEYSEELKGIVGISPRVLCDGY